MDQPQPSFFARHEFVIRRLHSLSGLIPVGAYMVVHLVTNATVLNGPGTFQDNVYKIHSLGSMLPVVEWTFIFIPILFHAIVGIWIVMGMNPNTSNYPYAANRRYTLQRITGMIAFFFIGWHVFHMHGWFHYEGWMTDVRIRTAGLNSGRSTPLRRPAGLQSGIVLAVYHWRLVLRVSLGQRHLDDGHHVGSLDQSQGSDASACRLHGVWRLARRRQHECARRDAGRRQR